MYALTVEDGTPIYTDYLNGELPDSDEVADMYDFGRGLLKKLGFERYEISNFAKAGFESRHNLNYWKRGEYIGAGVAASSFMKGKRFTNTFDLDEYMKCIISGFYPAVDCEEVSETDAKFEFVMLGLRTKYGVSLTEYENNSPPRSRGLSRSAREERTVFGSRRGYPADQGRIPVRAEFGVDAFYGGTPSARIKRIRKNEGKRLTKGGGGEYNIFWKKNIISLEKK